MQLIESHFLVISFGFWVITASVILINAVVTKIGYLRPVKQILFASDHIAKSIDFNPDTRIKANAIR
jgi:hypothetical protein